MNCPHCDKDIYIKESDWICPMCGGIEMITNGKYHECKECGFVGTDKEIREKYSDKNVSS